MKHNYSNWKALFSKLTDEKWKYLERPQGHLHSWLKVTLFKATLKCLLEINNEVWMCSFNYFKPKQVNVIFTNAETLSLPLKWSWKVNEARVAKSKLGIKVRQFQNFLNCQGISKNAQTFPEMPDFRNPLLQIDCIWKR